MTIGKLYSRPNEMWTAGFNHMATPGEYVAFVMGVFARGIVGRRVSRAMQADFLPTPMLLC